MPQERDESPGTCPGCGGTGTPGTPCAETACGRMGFHFLPAEYAASGTVQTRDLLVGRRVDEYLIARRIGRGGFGSVYLALQMPIRLKCALKVLHDSLEGQPGAQAILAKFRGEAEALASLNHPNIVRLLRFGALDWRPYMVMEFIDGQPLRDEMARARHEGVPLHRSFVERVLEQTLHGLEAAHAMDIVHRDIKPENILLQPVVGDRWFVRIVDFGLAKFVSHGTRTSMLSGTPEYMAPEQLLGHGIGPPCDVYSTAVFLYEMLAGRKLFGFEVSDEILVRKLQPDNDPMLEADCSMLSAAEVELLRKALSFSPEQRFPRAGAMLDAWRTLPGRGPAAAIATPAAAPPGPSVEPPESCPTDPAVREASTARTRGRRVRPARWQMLLAVLAVAAGIAGALALLLGRDGPQEPGPTAHTDSPPAPTAATRQEPAKAPPDTRGAHAADALAAAPGTPPPQDTVGGDTPGARPRIPDTVPEAGPRDPGQPDPRPGAVPPPDAAAPGPDAADAPPSQPDAAGDTASPAPADVTPDGPPPAGGKKGSGHRKEPTRIPAAGSADAEGLDRPGTAGKTRPREEEESGTQGKARPPEEKTGTGKAPPPELSATVRVTVRSVPPGALVRREGVVVGETPYGLEIPRGASVSLVLERAGFSSREVEVRGEKDGPVSFKLEPDSW